MRYLTAWDYDREAFRVYLGPSLYRGRPVDLWYRAYEGGRMEFTARGEGGLIACSQYEVDDPEFGLLCPEAPLDEAVRRYLLLRMAHHGQ